jgi:DNA-binding IclR family transcriptional regulator
MQTTVPLKETQTDEGLSPDTGLESVDLVLRLMELLANSAAPRRLTEIAGELGISKARAHRHLRALLHHRYVRQDADTERYEIGIKVLVLGEAVRDRFDVLTAMRPQMLRLRQATSQTVTASALVDDSVVVLELLQGRTLIEFGVRPGAALDLHASAHGMVALAFGPPRLRDKALSEPLKAWTRATVTRPKELATAIEKVRRQGWATAPDQVMPGVNALAAPVFDHRGQWCGTLALVGSTQFIPGRPPRFLIEQVTNAAAEASRSMGWKARAA